MQALQGTGRYDGLGMINIQYVFLNALKYRSNVQVSYAQMNFPAARTSGGIKMNFSEAVLVFLFSVPIFSVMCRQIRNDRLFCEISEVTTDCFFSFSRIIQIQ